jgi:hypothetical protein
MVEYAITLPIMLIMVFGIIEFGRIFQAWVTLQNSARAAARYASTGQFDRVKYPITENLEEDPSSVVHCTLNEDQRGAPVNIDAVGDTVAAYDGDEGLFATWYDGENCEPNRIDHQDMRKDIARILSIWDEARLGAAGLALGTDPLAGVDTQDEVEDFLYGLWDRPYPGDGNYHQHEGYDVPSFFDIMICSSRAPRNDPATVPDLNYQTRFITILDSSDSTAYPAIIGDNKQRAPVCVMNEIATAGLNHAGIPWQDAGGPGDAVTVVVTFNHPLVTPLGLAPYIQLQARRAAVNEAFRAAEATGALQGGPAITADINLPPRAVLTAEDSPGINASNEIVLLPGETTAAIFLDGCASFDQDEGHIVEWVYEQDEVGGVVTHLTTRVEGEPCEANPEFRTEGTWRFTLRVTDNEGAIATTEITIVIRPIDPTSPGTNTPPPTNTATAIPAFSCDLIRVSNVQFFNNRVFFDIDNNNFLGTELQRVLFNWRKVPAFPNMYVSGMALDGLLVWRGNDTNPPTDTSADFSNPVGMFLDSNRAIPGLSDVTWEGVFSNGPAPINDPFNNIFWMTQYDFAGSEFTFDNPESDTPCIVPLNLPTPTPSPTFNPAAGTPTPTRTPDCSAGQINIQFAGFGTPGAVRMTLTNLRSIPAELVAFRINWVKRNAGMALEYVMVGGNNVFDTTNGVMIWQSSVGGDQQPPTVGGNTAATAGIANGSGTGPEATWLTNYTVPPNTTTNVWFKFGVTSSSPDVAWGMQRSDLNGSWFELGCLGGTGTIPVFQEPSPMPSVTQGPTDTEPPTFTPTITRTPGPPPTATLVPSITNTRPPTQTPQPTATTEEPPPDDGGDVEGPDG